MSNQTFHYYKANIEHLTIMHSGSILLIQQSRIKPTIDSELIRDSGLFLQQFWDQLLMNHVSYYVHVFQIY